MRQSRGLKVSLAERDKGTVFDIFYEQARSEASGGSDSSVCRCLSVAATVRGDLINPESVAGNWVLWAKEQADRLDPLTGC